MKFFKRLWLAKCENQNNDEENNKSCIDYKLNFFSNEQTKNCDAEYDKCKRLQENAENLQKRLGKNIGCDNREIVTPDEFFTSPDIVELYQEEKMMSTWIIVDIGLENDEHLSRSKDNEEYHKPLAVIKGNPIFTTYDKESFRNSLMGPMLEPIFVSATRVSQLFQSKKGLSIQQAFGLSDDGSLLVNLDHILICKGTESLHYKFSVFSSYENGVEITDQYKMQRHFSLLKKIIGWIKGFLGTFSSV